MKIKFILIISILFVYSMAFASSREEFIKSLCKSFGVEEISKQSMVSYKAELLRIYKDLNDDVLKKEYNDIFVDAENNLLKSYYEAFNVYTDQELKKLAEFYNSDFGKWYSEKSGEYNKRVQANFESSYKELNNKFIERYQKNSNKKP